MIWLDVAKGIAIILMVLGHSGLPVSLNNFIFAFHMPFFFLASGLTTSFSKDLAFSAFAKQKAKGLLIPFLWYSLALYGLILFNPSVSMSLESLLFQGWGDWALWFVPILFLALLIAKLVISCPQWLKWTLFVALPLSSVILCYYKVFLPWKVSVQGYAVFFVISGHFIRSSGFFDKCTHFVKKPFWPIVLSFFLSSGLVLLISRYWRLDMALNAVLPIIPKTVGAFAGYVFLSIISILITIPTNRLSSLITRTLSGIGRETFLIMALSQIILVYVNAYFSFNAAIRYLLAIVVLVLCYYAKKIPKSILNTIIRKV